MVSRCRSNIGKRLAITTCDTFRSIPTDENGAIAKVEQSTPNLTSCGPYTSGVTRSSRMRSRFDLSEIELAFGVPAWPLANGLTPSISLLVFAKRRIARGGAREHGYRAPENLRRFSGYELQCLECPLCAKA